MIWREEMVVCMWYNGVWYNEVKQVGGEWEKTIGDERNVTRESNTSGGGNIRDGKRR
jgi:hypothetical protein